MKLIRILNYVLAALAGLYLLAAVLYAIPVISGALDEAMEVKFDRPDPSIVADYRNGLTPEQKETFYHLSQGSEILPWTPQARKAHTADPSRGGDMAAALARITAKAFVR